MMSGRTRKIHLHGAEDAVGCLSLILVVCLCLFCFVPLVRAGITWSGDIDPADPTTWRTRTIGYIGKTGSGSIYISSGDKLNISAGHIGYSSGSSGRATVNGTGSIWTNNRSLHVGNSGNGTLNIKNGGAASNGSGFIGYDYGSMGTVTVNGPGSTWTNSGLSIGVFGRGSLAITGGGTVNVGTSTIVSQFSSGSSGTIHFDNGTLTTETFLGAVNDLTGTGTINTNGIVSDVDLVFDATHGLNQTFHINDNPDQNITVNLTVDGSSYYMGAGYRSVGTMSISGGKVIESPTGYIGYKSGSTGEVTVNGPGSMWTGISDLYVGEYGSGILKITDSGTANTRNVYIGHESGSTGNVIVNGIGSTLTNDLQYFYVGNSGSGTLTITNGGAVSNNSDGYIANDSGSTGEVNVNGLGSTWTNNEDLFIGRSGSGILNITNGGTVSNRDGQIGDTVNSTGVVMVDGAHSTWKNDRDLIIEYGALNIMNGGAVSNISGHVGVYPHSTGEVTVDGMGSIWTNSENLNIGFDGSGTLNITNGGLVSVAGTLIIYNHIVGDGFVNMATGGRLALYGDADDSIFDFLGLVDGTDAIRYWDESITDWADIAGATYGEDYTLSYLTAGDLAGYTLLTVPEPVTLSLLVLGGAVMLRRRRTA